MTIVPGASETRQIAQLNTVDGRQAMIDFELRGTQVYVHWFHNEKRIRGYGTYLLSLLAKHMVRSGYRTMQLHPLTDSARLQRLYRYYTALGFQCTGPMCLNQLNNNPSVDDLVDRCHEMKANLRIVAARASAIWKAKSHGR